MSGTAADPPGPTARAAIRAGSQAHRQGRLDEAATRYREALAADPDNADAQHLLGLVAYQRGAAAEAVQRIQAAVAREPDRALFHNHLGLALQALGRPEDARAALERSVALAPGTAAAQNNLGTVRFDTGDVEGALEAYEAAAAADPEFAEAHYNRGAARRELGDYAGAEDACRRALSLAPRHADAHSVLAAVLLVTGRLAEGWREYEWRFAAPGYTAAPRVPAKPHWDGSALEGRTILLQAEQGLGDAIQFVRYAPLLARRGAQVAVECPAPLKRLFAGMAGVSRVAAREDPMPPHDVWAPMLSLGGLFGTTLETIPAPTPYLAAHKADAERWAGRLADAPRPRVGLVWAGHPGHRNDRNRSIAPERLAPLIEANQGTWFALQKGPGAAGLDEPPLAGRVRDLGPELDDMADTAAAVSALDLVVTVDTAVAHLAGAMGAPVWVLLPFVPDWRWLLGRAGSPWYPSMRLFRQPARGDWDTPVRQAAKALAALETADG